MKRTIAKAAILLILALPLVGTLGAAPGMRQEAREHPRIARAIHSLEDAIDYMQKAPHDFGGHRAEAVAASRAAVEQLKLALAYRAGSDAHK